jgi:hypothetical protein
MAIPRHNALLKSPFQHSIPALPGFPCVAVVGANCFTFHVEPYFNVQFLIMGYFRGGCLALRGKGLRRTNDMVVKDLPMVSTSLTRYDAIKVPWKYYVNVSLPAYLWLTASYIALK